MNDNQILQELKNHNSPVITDVYNAYHNKFLRFASKNYKVDEQIARDVYQEVFLILIKNVKAGKLTELTSSLETYLFQIGKFQLNNYLRSKNKYGNSITTEIPDDAFSTVDHEEKEIKLGIVVNSIKLLDQKCAHLISQFYIQRGKYENLMKSLGFSSLDSIKTQKYKCMKKLESLVKAEFSHANLSY